MRSNLSPRAGAGHFRAAAAAGPRLARRARNRRSRDAEPHIAANAMCASAMWAANAATVSPAPDTADGKCHLTVANLKTMPHRSHEWPATLAQLRLAFASTAFAVHGAGPAGVRRRRRGQPYAAGAVAWRAGHRGVRLWRVRAAPSPPASMSRRRRRSRGSTGSTPSGPSSPRKARRRSPPAPSTMTWSRSPTARCCSPMRRRSPTATRWSPNWPPRCPASNWSRCPTPKSRWPMPSDPICSTPSW